eukprot:PITA_07444
MDGHFEDIIHFLTTGTAPEGYTIQQKKELVVRAVDFSVIARHLYKMGSNEILRRTSRPSLRDELPLNPQMTLQPFEKWAIDFVGAIQPQGKTGARYIIIATEYLTGWTKAQPIKDCTVTTTTKFLFEYVLARFGCPNILMSDCGTHFLNETISALTEDFQVYHQKSTPYHSQANGTVEAFNKVIENTPTKV